MSRNRFIGLAALLIVVAGTAVGVALSATGADPAVAAARRATSKYQRLDVAISGRYDLLVDSNKIACIDLPGTGGMGIHFVNGDLVGDGEVLADHPEALVYDPTPQGLRLVALEFIVFKDAWRKEHPHGKPQLFGRTFEPVGADNRYGIPPFFELHVWAWKHNPAGLFEDWNPRVTC